MVWSESLGIMFELSINKLNCYVQFTQLKIWYYFHNNAGFVFYYCALQVSTLCLFYSGALLWSIMFPFQYRRYEKENKLKYVHITTALLALLLPLVSSFVILAFGYARSYNHESICPGRNSDSIYAGVTLPMSIMGAVSSSILVVVFWAIFKVSLEFNPRTVNNTCMS